VAAKIRAYIAGCQDAEAYRFRCAEWVRAQPLLGNLVVVMLSTSDEAKDLERATQRGVHTYLLKFPSAATLAALVRLIRDVPICGPTPQYGD